jgi:hypothetical protein
VTQWSASLLADHLRRTEKPVVLSARSVARILAAAPLQPHRQKMWLNSHDEDFCTKRDDVAYSGRLGHPFRQHPGTRSGGIPPGSERSDGALDRDRSAATGSWIDGDSPLGEGTLG